VKEVGIWKIKLLSYNMLWQANFHYDHPVTGPAPGG